MAVANDVPGPPTSSSVSRDEGGEQGQASERELREVHRVKLRGRWAEVSDREKRERQKGSPSRSHVQVRVNREG
jgi:hypothetical protein